MRQLAFLFLSFGLTLAIVARAPLGKEVTELVMADGDSVELGEHLTVSLDTFTIPVYPSGAPRQYVSRVKVLDRETKELEAAEISVNHPLRKRGWWIYQYGYGLDEDDVFCTQLKCVKDPLVWLAAIGGLLVVLGAVLMCWTGRTGETPVPRGGAQRLVERASRPFGQSVPRKALAWAAALLTVALPAFIIGRAVLRPEPVPALQSWLMAPHVAAYAASYVLLLFAAFGIGRRFVPVGFLLMTLGLVLGAVWGKLAWSEWWQFDPKENWSFLTWLAFATHLWFPPGSRAAKWALRIGAVLIVITLTFVNFSRYAVGLHSYA